MNAAARWWARLRQLLRVGDGETAEGRAVDFLVLALILAGIVLRTRGLATLPLWQDECVWAVRLVELPLSTHEIRPLGFMALSRWLVAVFGPWEATLRALPWLAGVASLLLAPALARRTFDGAAPRALFVAVLALHPSAIDLSKDFKPYALGLGLHVGLALLARRYVDSNGARDLFGALALAVLGPLFALDVVFALPGTFLLLAWTAFRGGRRRDLGFVLGGLVVSLGMLFLLYFAFWAGLDMSSEEAYWGKRYDVFYQSKDGGARLDWMLAKLSEMAAWPGSRRALWSPWPFSQRFVVEWQAIDRLAWVVTAGFGLLAAMRRQRPLDGFLVLCPLVVMTFMNTIGLWPLGAFRTNLFALVYVASIAGLAFDTPAEPATQPRSAFPAWLPTALLVLLPLLAFERSYHAIKRFDSWYSSFPEALDRLVALQGKIPAQPEGLILDSWSCSSLNYYTRYQPSVAERIGKELAQRFSTRCDGSTSKITRSLFKHARAEGRAWLLVSRPSHLPDVQRAVTGKLEDGLVKEHEVLIGEDAHWLASVRRAGPKSSR